MKWLDNRAFTLPIYYCLCLGEVDTRKALKRLKAPDWKTMQWGGGASNATTIFLANNEVNKDAAIVSLDTETFNNADQIQIIALLVHESVHIWQECCKLIGENEPSAEFEAYSIQTISQNLIYSYKEQRDKLEKIKAQ